MFIYNLFELIISWRHYLAALLIQNELNSFFSFTKIQNQITLSFHQAKGLKYHL